MAIQIKIYEQSLKKFGAIDQIFSKNKKAWMTSTQDFRVMTRDADIYRLNFTGLRFVRLSFTGVDTVFKRKLKMTGFTALGE